MTILSSNSAGLHKVERVFHSVGQGGFYTELFDNDQMIVYDCGSYSLNMCGYLDSFLHQDSKQQIPAIFISHLHGDHMNGLQNLMDKTDVKRVFIPTLTPGNMFEAFLYNKLNHSTQNNVDDAIFLVKAAQTHKYKDTEIIQVLDEDTEIDADRGLKTLYPYSEIKQPFGDSIASGTHLSINMGEVNWVYIPYYSKPKDPNWTQLDKEEVLQIKNILKITSITEQAEAIADFIKGHTVNYCKKIYLSLFGSVHNSQSMTVFSGILSHNTKIYTETNLTYSHCYYPCSGEESICCLRNHIPCNFLYTGDFEAKNKQNMFKLKDFYITLGVWNSLCGIQIPHHGARNNLNPELYKGKCFAIASAGIKNTYNHPHIETIISTVQQGCCPHIVTEDINSIIYQQFKF